MCKLKSCIILKDRVFIPDYNRYTDIARGRHFIKDCENVKVFGGSKVTAFGNSNVAAYNSSTVTTYNNCTVMAYDVSTIEVHNDSTVEAYEGSIVTAYGESTVETYENSTVKAFGDSIVTMPQCSPSKRENISLQGNSMLKNCKAETSNKRKRKEARSNV